MVQEIPEMNKQTRPQTPRVLHRFSTTPVPKGSLPHPIPCKPRAQLVQRLCGPRGALSRVQRITSG